MRHRLELALLLLSPHTVWARPPTVRFLDQQNQPIDVVTSGVDVARDAPSRLAANPFASAISPDANTFRVVFIGGDDGNPQTKPSAIDVTSFGVRGRRLDVLAHVSLLDVPCPADVPSGTTCRSTLPLRPVMDEVDRMHPLAVDRALQAELGGTLFVGSLGSPPLAAVRVVGPRLPAPIGFIDRLRGKVRVFLVRDRARGAPPFGKNDETALRLARLQIQRSNALWAQCGISFGPPEQADVRLVDPPAGHMIAVGCDLGTPAFGGDLRVNVDGVEVRAALMAGDLPRTAARRLARSVEKLGLVARVSDNMRIGPGAFGSSDVLVRRPDGSRALVALPARGDVSSDDSLRACVGSVDLTDGLQHFTDADAVAGTVEERALLKAFDDGDPRTIEVIFIPSFATGGRIGESFIGGDRSSLSNMLIEDRAGVRADRISFALAHELGHVLLDVPGHTDDFGSDTPLSLMDSDAADPSPFGPRRLTAAECERAVRQSGPNAPTPLLQPWPLPPLRF